MTPLQVYTRVLLGVLRNAREELTDEQYSWLVAVATEAIGLEAARLAVGEAIRAKRADEQGQAA